MEEEQDADEEVDAFGSGGISRFLDRISRPVRNLLKVEPAVWDEDDVEYDFSHKSRGIMVIINNEHYRGTSPRNGTNIDAENLEKTFSNLGFEVFVYKNQTRSQMLTIFKKARKSDHSNSDCFACAILTHGEQVHKVDRSCPRRHEREDQVYAIDQEILTSDIVKMFTDMNCPSLAGKPRLFFMQACRGRNLDSGVDLTLMPTNEADAVKNDFYEVTPSPIYQDFLIMYATPPGYYAMRRVDTGSWFIDSLCEVMSKPEVRQRSLNQLLTAVIKLVSMEFESINYKGAKQTPCFASMLTKDVHFKSKETSKPV